jgi:CelD/BcsL family acetyltransferase involved in cellulose biosynthesis
MKSILGLRDEWNQLLSLNATNSVFLTFEYVFHWYDHYCGGAKSTYLLLAFSDEGRLIGVAPLYIEAEGRVPIQRRVLKFAGSNAACAEYLDFVVQKGNEEAILQALFEYILTDRLRWDKIVLTDLKQGSNIISSMPVFDTRGTATIHDSRVCLYTELPYTWGEFEKGLSKKYVKKVRYYERRLNREGSCETGVFKDVEKGMGDLYRVHQNRWGERGIYGSFTSDTAKSFNLALAKEFDRKGYLRLYYLKYEGEVAAVLYCFLYNAKLYFFNGGFDPKYAKYNVSTILIKHSINDAIESKCLEYDFLRGISQYKYDWGARERRQLSWSIDRLTIPNICLNMIQGASRVLNKAIARSVPERLRVRLGGEIRRLKSRSRLYE